LKNSINRTTILARRRDGEILPRRLRGHTSMVKILMRTMTFMMIDDDEVNDSDCDPYELKHAKYR